MNPVGSGCGWYVIQDFSSGHPIDSETDARTTIHRTGCLLILSRGTLLPRRVKSLGLIVRVDAQPPPNTNCGKMYLCSADTPAASRFQLRTMFPDAYCGIGEFIGLAYKPADPTGQKWKSRVRRPTQEELQ